MDQQLSSCVHYRARPSSIGKRLNVVIRNSTAMRKVMFGARRHTSILYSSAAMLNNAYHFPHHPRTPSQAVELKSDFRSALFNLALLLSDSGRPLEAAPFLHSLVRYHPDHVKAFILLGDIYVNNMRDLDEAERVGLGLTYCSSSPQRLCPVLSPVPNRSSSGQR